MAKKRKTKIRLRDAKTGRFVALDDGIIVLGNDYYDPKLDKYVKKPQGMVLKNGE